MGPNPDHPWRQAMRPLRDGWAVARRSGAVALCLLAGLAGWVATAPRADVAMAPAVIVPDGNIASGAELLLDARVAPVDIDQVRAGLSAQVHLPAYKSRYMPRIEGTVREVSADPQEDPTNHQPYYLARVAIAPETLPAGIVLSVGMPADVTIVTSERTLLAQLIRPLTETLRRGLREG